jgi:hypothetical protein
VHSVEAGAQGAAGLPPVAELLSMGGDGRIHLDSESGANRYGCAARPDEGLVAFGSSTASTISADAFAAADHLRARLIRALDSAPASEVYAAEADRVRGEFLQLLGLGGRGAEVVLAPSGTDLHLFAAQLVASGEEPPLAIIPEETETGSGVPAALAGRGPAAPGHASGGLYPVEVKAVPSRGPDGRPRAPGEADAEVRALAETALADDRPVLLVLIDVSKTGLISPSPACAQDLAARHPGRVTVLVDACQLRLSGASLGAYLDGGAMVAVTGSKFLTGPAFSAALLVPPVLAHAFAGRQVPQMLSAVSAAADWPEGWAARTQLAPAANFGLLIRWEAALAELRRFAAVSGAQAQAFIAAFARTAREAIDAQPGLEPLEGRGLERGLEADGGWDRLATVFPFRIRSGPGGARLSGEAVQKVWRLMREDLGAVAAHETIPARAAARLRIELGQPVAAGTRDGEPVSALRLCLSSRLIAEATAGDPRAAARILSDTRLALAKAAWLGRQVAAGRL